MLDLFRNCWGAFHSTIPARLWTDISMVRFSYLQCDILKNLGKDMIRRVTNLHFALFCCRRLVTASPSPPARLPHYSGTLYSQSQPFPIFAWSFLANMT